MCFKSAEKVRDQSSLFITKRVSEAKVLTFDSERAMVTQGEYPAACRGNEMNSDSFQCPELAPGLIPFICINLDSVRLRLYFVYFMLTG